MKVTYQLADDVAKMLIGMKLKKKAFEWLHSRAEHLTMTFDEFINEIGLMYRPKQSKIDLRKRFEARVWRKGETFREYANDKVIMGNSIPVDVDDLLDYLIERIPDQTLCNQARMQSFTTKGSLIDAFDKIMLREQTSTNSMQQEKRNVMAARSMGGGKSIGSDKNEPGRDKRKMNNRKSSLSTAVSLIT